MLKIGVTGGIGSGKSVVCKAFESCGAPTYNADDAAKRLMQENDLLKNDIEANFGSVYDKHGILQREKLADIIFGNPDSLKMLNSLVHPAVIADYDQWQALQTFHYIIKESAILFESETNKGLDFIIVVEAPESIRIKRIMLRDNRTEKQIRDIMKNQMPDVKRNERADFIIVNNDEVPLLPQVWTLHEKFLHGIK